MDVYRFRRRYVWCIFQRILFPPCATNASARTRRRWRTLRGIIVGIAMILYRLWQIEIVITHYNFWILHDSEKMYFSLDATPRLSVNTEDVLRGEILWGLPPRWFCIAMIESNPICLTNGRFIVMVTDRRSIMILRYRRTVGVLFTLNTWSLNFYGERRSNDFVFRFCFGYRSVTIDPRQSWISNGVGKFWVSICKRFYEIYAFGHDRMAFVEPFSCLWDTLGRTSACWDRCVRVRWFFIERASGVNTKRRSITFLACMPLI